MIKWSGACIWSFHYLTASCVVFLSPAYILGDDTKAGKQSETQAVESLQILHAKNPEDKCLGELKICTSV